MPVILMHGKLKQEGCEFKASLNYVTTLKAAPLPNRLSKTTTPSCWLMPVILAAQEAEIRRIKVQSQPGSSSRCRP
jgi:hypothetical protein